MDLDLGGILDGAPHFVRCIVWAAIVCFCGGFILRFLSPLGRAAVIIIKELSPNGGNSVKDLIGKSIRQNDQALEKIDSLDKRLSGDIATLREAMKTSDTERDGIKQQVQELQTQFSKFVHEDNTRHMRVQT